METKTTFILAALEFGAVGLFMTVLGIAGFILGGYLTPIAITSLIIAISAIIMTSVAIYWKYQKTSW